MKQPGRLGKFKVAIVVILCCVTLRMGVGSTCRLSLRRAREAVAKQDLVVMREAIRLYTSDKEHPPQSLQDLVNEGYLRRIPTDPSTGKEDWVLHLGDVMVGPGKTLFGIDDVNSNGAK
jgi:general secretion pathway protein G